MGTGVILFCISSVFPVNEKQGSERKEDCEAASLADGGAVN